MPSYTAQSSSATAVAKRDLATLLDAARPFLRGELESVDPALPSLLAVLRSVGAGECWHKHSTFLAHLTDVYRALKIWCAPDPVARCGLFHSAYSNSYVNLAIFDPNTGRDEVRSLIGAPAERLVHLFCIVPRQLLIHDRLLFHYSDAELADHLLLADESLRRAREEGAFDSAEPWRAKLRALLPAEGIRTEHIKTGDAVPLSRRVAAAFLLMTMVDFADQLFDFQDKLFDNDDGRLTFRGNSRTALWPGEGKPGLWLNSISRMGVLYSLIVREEEIYAEERKRSSAASASYQSGAERDEDLELITPPVFDNCTRILDAKDQAEARDLYWEAVCSSGKEQQRAAKLLAESCEKNPFVGEPHLVLAQVYLAMARFEEAEREAEKGLKLLLEWGSSWDKRMSWEGWVAWGRVLLMKAKEKTWPETSWGILNLGLVD
ncbi:uncharacterized protein LOC122032621 [Zingiber officinale]|uniref:DUF6817 domain-containing protein n=1 Tax=Zingiber officinale TaxID=94328 RepID=A0A8J5BDU9_ZINOF|nr:uncharacterized protein LOC122032621 [Zingiber officinale]KAG6470006.1 hypothetical protein ZIOFF_070946 [Zingiber officinale]